MAEYVAQQSTAQCSKHMQQVMSRASLCVTCVIRQVTPQVQSYTLPGLARLQQGVCAGSDSFIDCRVSTNVQHLCGHFNSNSVVALAMPQTKGMEEVSTKPWAWAPGTRSCAVGCGRPHYRTKRSVLLSCCMPDDHCLTIDIAGAHMLMMV